MPSRDDDVGRSMLSEYRRASSRPSVRAQSRRLLADLDDLETLTGRGDLTAARGAALAAARAALALSVTPVVGDRGRRLRQKLLRERVLPALRRAGLGHAEALVEAALGLDVDPCTISPGAEAVQ